MKIKIKGIFKKYNTEFDFSKKNTIYIGENGIGKSTSIKILNCILKLDFVSLLHYYFSEVEFIDEDKYMNFTYDDFALNIDYIKKKFVGEEYFDFFLAIEDEAEKVPEGYTLPMLEPSNFEKDISADKVSELQYYYLPLICVLKVLIKKCHYKLLRFDKKIGKELKNIEFKHILLKNLKQIYDEALIDDNQGKVYIQSNFFKYIDDIKTFIKKLQFNQSFILNLANDFNVTNDVDVRYAVNELETKLNNTAIEKVLEKYRTSYEKYEISKNFDIGKYLFANVYNEELLKEFCKDYYSFLYNNIDKVSQLTKYHIKDTTFEKMKLYLKPILPIGSMFDSILNANTNDYYVNGDETYDDYILLCNFYQTYQNKYINIDNDKLKKLNELFLKYFKNKYVVATPFGIVISSNDDYKNDIDFEDLSAGERKLIILFTVAIFSDNMIVLLDEPETSLSVIWQKELLNDLTKNSNYKNLIVCTQSPFIVSDDMIKNVICLPMGDSNE